MKFCETTIKLYYKKRLKSLWFEPGTTGERPIPSDGREKAADDDDDEMLG